MKSKQHSTWSQQSMQLLSTWQVKFPTRWWRGVDKEMHLCATDQSTSKYSPWVNFVFMLNVAKFEKSILSCIFYNLNCIICMVRKYLQFFPVINPRKLVHSLFHMLSIESKKPFIPVSGGWKGVPCSKDGLVIQVILCFYDYIVVSRNILRYITNN